MQLDDRADVAAVDLAFATLEPDPPAEPSLGDRHADAVHALGQPVGHVMRLDPDAMAIARPAGRQHLVADDVAIALGLVDPERADAQFRGQETGANIEL